jgi:hypothetical protein
MINSEIRRIMSAVTEKTKDLLKMLGSTIAVVGSAVWFLAHQMHSMETRLVNQINSLDKRITVIETVLIMQGYPIKHVAIQEKTNG